MQREGLYFLINLGLGLSPETRAPKHRIKSPKIFPQRVEKQSAKNTKAHKKISPISIALLTTRIFYPQQVTDYPYIFLLLKWREYSYYSHFFGPIIISAL